MRVKRFVANSMQEAIAQVKADFGHEAVILHTKKLRRGGLFGLFGKGKVEVIAATDAKAPRKSAVGPVRRLSPMASSPVAATGDDAAAASPISVVQRELDEIKRTLKSWAPQETTAMPSGVKAAFDQLIEQDVREDLAREALAAVRARGSAEQLEDDAWVRRELFDVLSKSVACADPWEVADGARVQCLVGPTGVGKTTTIAKLAANYALLGGKEVALVTVDTYRIAAVEQLKTYAEIIGVPVDVAFTPGELKEALNRRSSYDMVLVDTAGRSQKNKMQMAELRAFLDVMDDPQIHLVISATTRQKDMVEIVERFGQLPIAFLIATKLDETSSYGLLYNACRLTGKALSYVTNGQNVPDDIEVAEAAKIAGMMLGVSE